MSLEKFLSGLVRFCLVEFVSLRVDRYLRATRLENLFTSGPFLLKPLFAYSFRLAALGFFFSLSLRCLSAFAV